MKKVEAIIKPFKIDDVKAKLARAARAKRRSAGGAVAPYSSDTAR
jgi:hypothetical protein